MVERVEHIGKPRGSNLIELRSKDDLYHFGLFEGEVQPQ
jgi:hypothetical protein